MSQISKASLIRRKLPVRRMAKAYLAAILLFGLLFVSFNSSLDTLRLTVLWLLGSFAISLIVRSWLKERMK